MNLSLLDEYLRNICELFAFDRGKFSRSFEIRPFEIEFIIIGYNHIK